VWILVRCIKKCMANICSTIHSLFIGVYVHQFALMTVSPE